MSTGARAALFVLICGAAACSPSTDFERMRQQPRAEPYAASAAFPNGMAMRVPPSGTVPIESQTADENAGRGAHDFQVFCAVCHGGDGSGRSVMASNMPGTPPPSLLSRDVVTLPDDQLFDVISAGKNRMPAFGWAMTRSERQAVVAYVRTLQGSTRATAGAVR